MKVPALHLAELAEAVREAKRAAHGDSNDAEIQALAEALDVACRLLGFDTSAIEEEVWAEVEAAEARA